MASFRVGEGYTYVRCVTTESQDWWVDEHANLTISRSNQQETCK